MKKTLFTALVTKSSMLLGAAIVFSGNLMAQPSGPPPIPAAGNTPPCWPPPCIPIDQGTVFLIAGAVLMGGYFLLRQRKGLAMNA